MRTIVIAVFGVGLCVATRVSAQTLTLTPRMALADEPVRIAATGLRPRATVILRAKRTDRDGRMWESTAFVRTDGRGAFDLSRQPSDSGSYHGVKPMGLITAMDIPGDGRGRTRYAFAWTDTLRTELTVEVDGRRLVTDTLSQFFSARGVRARSVRDSGLVATLFLPAGRRRAPAVIVLGGSEGGLGSEEIAAQLASRGYAAMALAYFGIDPLPAALDAIPLEYFGVAIRHLLRDRSVAPGKVGILATSKGAEAALALAAFVPETPISAIVAYVPSSVVWSCICSGPRSSWTLGGGDLPNVPAGSDPQYRPAPGTGMRPAVNYTYRLRDSVTAASAAIPVERIRAPLLMIAGDDDGLWPSLPMARAVLERRKRGATAGRDILLAYPGAGHLIGKSYLPGGTTLIGGGRLESGGSVTANSAAQADSWPRVLRFLEANTGVTPSRR